MSDIKNFVHLHNHTEYSFLDGAMRIPSFVQRAAEFGMPALAITDHGGLFGAVEFFDTCKKHDVHPILGFEAYVSPGDSTYKASTGKRNNHLILLAENNKGWENLMILCSHGYLNGFYYKPRVDLEMLKRHSEGLIATSACIGGAVQQAIIKDDIEEARLLTDQYLDIFGEGNFFFELQNHNIADEAKANKGMLEIAKEKGVPFVAANDAHYLNQEDARAHEVLLCMQTQGLMSDPNHYRFESDEMYLKSQEQMAELFADLPDAITNTYEIAKRCEVKIHNEPQLPSSGIPENFNTEDDYLRELTMEGAAKHYPDMTAEIQERIDYELGIIKSMGFPGYFLIVRDFLIAADEMGITRGCRGSAAGSIVAFCIGITNVDPIKFDLIFERFLNPERISMPDVDADIADADRYRLIDYVVKKYGREAVCQIINFGRMKAKAAVKDVARVMGVSVSDANRLSSMINEKNIQKSLEASEELRETVENSPTFQEVFKYAQSLEGMARQPGMHAGGVIIAPGNVHTWSPLFKQTKNELVMTQFDMKYVESVGLIKIDMLGLRTLTVLQNAIALVKQNHGVEIDIWGLDYEDKETFKLFHKGETTDVFQFESQGMQNYLKKLKPTSVEDLIAMTALYRPGPMSNIDSFINRKHGREPINYPHPMLKEILDVTYGIIIYQEQVMRIAQKMGGFTLGQADILRKAMGKKQADKMEEMKVKFVQGAKERDIDPKVAEEVYALIAKFAEYGFNKAHATVYAHVSYQAAFLKVHYPCEYMTAVLTSHIGEKEKFLTAKTEAERIGLKVVPPDVNFSENDCTIADGQICIGLSAIANVGKASEEIISVRKKEGPFKSFFDMCSKVNTRLVNKKSLESLIMAGALRSFQGNRNQLFSCIEQALEYGGSFQKERTSGQTNLFSMVANNTQSFTLPEPALPKVEEWTFQEILAREKEVMNFYLSGHPLDTFEDEVRGFTTLSLNSETVANTADNKNVLIGGVITSAKKIITKKGKEMAFLEIEDFEGAIECVCFPDTFLEYNSFVNVDEMVLIRGTLQKKEGKNAVIIEKIMSLKEARDKLTKAVHIQLETEKLTKKLLNQIHSTVKKHQGTCNLILHVQANDGSEYKMNAKELKVTADVETLNAFREKLGKDKVWIGMRAA